MQVACEGCVCAGVTLNWGVLLSWSAVCACVQWPAVAMYVFAVMLTVHYDTVYSHQVAM